MKLFSILPALVSLAPLVVWAGPVDINTADAATLAKELKGVGPSRATAEVALRSRVPSLGPSSMVPTLCQPAAACGPAGAAPLEA